MSFLYNDFRSLEKSLLCSHHHHDTKCLAIQEMQDVQDLVFTTHFQNDVSWTNQVRDGEMGSKRSLILMAFIAEELKMPQSCAHESKNKKKHQLFKIPLYS